MDLNANGHNRLAGDRVRTCCWVCPDRSPNRNSNTCCGIESSARSNSKPLSSEHQVAFETARSITDEHLHLQTHQRRRLLEHQHVPLPRACAPRAVAARSLCPFRPIGAAAAGTWQSLPARTVAQCEQGRASYSGTCSKAAREPSLPARSWAAALRYAQLRLRRVAARRRSIGLCH